jgi:hypothetical protein
MASEDKIQVNIRLTPTAKRILVKLSDVYGVAQGDVLEILLRLEAARLRLPGHEQSVLRAPGGSP